jgi:hypothetical protein
MEAIVAGQRARICMNDIDEPACLDAVVLRTLPNNVNVLMLTYILA